MNSPSSRNIPHFKNVTPKHKQSPIELKENMRKDYKAKIHNCRDMLLNRFRGTGEQDVKNTLNEIYKSLFDLTDNFTLETEESELFEEIKNELIQEELKWCTEEYERTQFENYDWSSIENEDVICPVCQKNNFTLKMKSLSCSYCKICLNTDKSLIEIKKQIVDLVDKHNASCGNNVQFIVVPNDKDDQICLVCGTCMDMQVLI